MGKLDLHNEVKILEEKVQQLSHELTRTNDIIAIEKLQRIYGYYLDVKMHQEIVDLFSDNAESVEIGNRGVYLGKEGARRFFLESQGRPRPAWSMGKHLQLQGVVDISPDGKTAEGRWQCVFLCVSLWGNPENPTDCWSYGVYENVYVKENGKWLFKKVYFNRLFYTPVSEGWVKVPDMTIWKLGPETCDIPSTTHHPYPTDFVVPMHYKHPITGK
jgi:hypothetical protein